MPFSRQNKAVHGKITTITEHILDDAAADEQTKMIAAVVATQGLGAVLKEVDQVIYNGGRDDWGSKAAFEKWNTTQKIEDLASYAKMEKDLNALGVSDSAVAGVMRKTSEYIAAAYTNQLGR